jgi:cytochrome o ubiquinol oxidase subunit 2
MTLLWLLGSVLVIGVLVWLSWGHPFPLIQTRGDIANRQRDLLFFATLLALLVLLPVYFLIFTFAWRYRAGHRKEYKPEWASHKGYEALWWGIPIAIISVLAVVTWVTSHSLDPFKPVASQQKPLHIQVVALQWKWLFLYPEQHVASVNEFAFPVDRPVELTITSDAPMNSFWLPQLAGQIYAMSGMSTQLHIQANARGDYKGVSSNISGKGFADMRFTARAMSRPEYGAWLLHAVDTGNRMDMTAYEKLAQPGVSKTMFFGLDDTGLYDRVILKYMAGSTEHTQNGMKPTDADQPSPTKSSADEGMDMTHMEGM